MQTPASSVAMFAVAGLFGALGQLLYKAGADAADGSVRGFLLNARIAGGIALYIAVMVLFVAAFRRGGSLSVLYPVYATTFIWAALLSLYFYDTPIKMIHVMGMMLLLIGMYCMGR